MLYKRIVVGDQERVLVSRNCRFETILEPGDHRIFVSPFQSLRTETFKLADLVFESGWNNFLVQRRPAVVERFFHLIETGENQVAMIFVDKNLYKVLAPGKRMLFWRDAAEVTAEVIGVLDQPQVPAAHLAALERLGAASLAMFANVEDGRVGLLYLDNCLVRTIGPGKYGFWTVSGSPRVDVVDLRRQPLEVPGQEVLTKDKVSLRVNILAEYQVTDAVKAKQVVKDYAAHLYRALQLSVRQTLARKTLEEVLADKTDVDETVAAEVRAEMEVLGVRVGAIALKDIILPGEMRDIMNQVVAAEKQAQANLIRRREETAATRSLLNTAKLMEGNPVLVRLKELETLEKLVEKVHTLNVLGGLDSLLKGP